MARTRFLPTWSSVATLTVSMTFTSSGIADAPAGSGTGKPGLSSEATVSDHVRRGNAAQNAAHWAEAQAAYSAAWALEKSPVIAGELGVSEVALGRYRDAAKHLQLALENSEALTPGQTRRFAKAQREATAHVGTLTISVNPPDAEVLIDGISLGQPELTYVVFVDPGAHTVRARLAHHGDALVTTVAMPGKRSIVALHLNEIITPTIAPQPSPRVPHDTGDDSLAAPLRYVGFAAAGASAALGAGLMIAAAVVDDEVKDRAATLGIRGACRSDPPASCADLSGLNETRDDLAGGVVISFIAAGLIGGVTVSSWWWAEDEHPTTVRLRTFPVATAQGAGVVLQGSW